MCRIEVGIRCVCERLEVRPGKPVRTAYDDRPSGPLGRPKGVALDILEEKTRNGI